MPNGYIMGDNGIPLELIDVATREGIEALFQRIERFGGYAVPISSAGSSDVDQYLAHEIAIVDGKIMDTVTGQDLTDTGHLEIDSTGQYMRVASRNSALISFDELREYTVEYITTDEFMENPGGDIEVANLLYSSSWSEGIRAKNRYGYKTYGGLDYRTPQLTNYSMYDCSASRYLNVYSDRAVTSEVFVAVAVSESAASLIFNVQGKSVDYSDSLDTTKEFRPCKMLAPGHVGAYYKRIRVYNKALTAEELDMAFASSGTYMYGKTADGLVPLGSAVAYTRLMDGTPAIVDKPASAPGVYTGDFGGEYTNREFEYPEMGNDVSGYTDCSIYSKISSIRVGDMVAVNALPHPFSAAQKYLIEWKSSDPDTIGCVDGLLTAYKAGSATITATIAGTNISDSITITVEDAPVIELKYYYPTIEEYAFGDSNPETVMQAIQIALTVALDGDYNGIVFPKMDYYIKPVITNATYKRCVLIMKDNFVVDFNGSTWYMLDNEYCHCVADAVDHDDGYNLFNVKFCGGVVFKNLTYYGERTYMADANRTENEYTEFVTFLKIGEGAIRFRMENVIFYNTVGFNISTKSGLFGGDRIHSKLHYSDFASGHVADDGTVEVHDNCICTPNYMPITVSEDRRYRFGFLAYTSYHSIASRLYDCLFYDADYNFIKADRLNHQYDLYDIPENAAYFKVNFYQSAVPTEDTPDQLGNEYSIAMFGFSGPNLCRITNCRFYNPHASAISITGGQRFVIDHCYTENGKRYAWSVDFEDGWLEMRSNVIVKNICFGKWFMVMGNGNKFQNNFFSALSMNRFNENSSVVNNHIRTWNQSERYSGVDAYNYVAKVVDTEANSGSGWINQWNTWNRDESEEYGYTAY